MTAYAAFNGKGQDHGTRHTGSFPDYYGRPAAKLRTQAHTMALLDGLDDHLGTRIPARVPRRYLTTLADAFLAEADSALDAFDLDAALADTFYAVDRVRGVNELEDPDDAIVWASDRDSLDDSLELLQQEGPEEDRVHDQASRLPTAADLGLDITSAFRRVTQLEYDVTGDRPDLAWDGFHVV